MAKAEKFQIVLEKVPDEKQPETALFLSGCFSLPPASTKGIANSGPIALIAGMGKAQAEAVVAELSASLPAGVNLHLAEEDESGAISRLQWPRPPRIYGRDLIDFAHPEESHDVNCPVCGNLIRITVDSKGGIRAAAKREKTSETERRQLQPGDMDPLFSGVKPLASISSDLASLRSLSAGDTGFWMDYSQNAFAPEPGEATPLPVNSGETSHGRRSTNRLSAGLAAFMKPGAFAVVVGRTRDNQAVKMIAEIMGVSEDEARDKCMNLGLCVARDISLDEAQNLLSRFKSLGAKVRIVKPQ